MSDILDDPRPDLLASAAWLGQVVRGVKPDQIGDPTPCEGWTVQDLLNHCVHVVRLTTARAGAGEEEPVPEHVPADGWAALYDRAEADMRGALVDPAVLTRTITTPRGQTVYGDFLRMFTGEFLVHAWDLAVSTDQPSEGPCDVVERTLVHAAQTHPAESRNPKGFAPVAEVAPDAGPTRRLAAWMGR